MTPGTGESDRCLVASVIIPARNAETTIGAQLSALARQDFDGDWEVVVADNGSTDRTAVIIEHHQREFPQLRCVTAHHAAGINVARNAGAARARGGILLFCDADDEVTPNWLTRMVETMEGAPAAAGHLDLTKLNHPRYWPAHLRGARREALPPVLDFLPYPVGASCAVRRDIWESLGGFDEAFVYGGEEIEFFWRVQLAGYELDYAPAATVYYRLPSSTRDAMRRGFAKGRATALLYDRFAEHGARFRPLVSARSWFGLLGRSYRLLGPSATRHSWLLRASQQLGRVRGGLEQRRFFF